MHNGDKCKVFCLPLTLMAHVSPLVSASPSLSQVCSLAKQHVQAVMSYNTTSADKVCQPVWGYR